MFKIGDKVIALNDRCSYIQLDLRNRVGVVKNVYNDMVKPGVTKVGVEFESVINPHSGRNMLWFMEDELRPYVHPDDLPQRTFYEQYYNFMKSFAPYHKAHILHRILNVKFSGPATIVFFEDKTKIVVKCNKKDAYDPEYAIMFAYLRKHLGYSSTKLQKFIKSNSADSEKAFMLGYLMSALDASRADMQKWLDKWTEDVVIPTGSYNHAIFDSKPVTFEFTTTNLNDAILNKILYPENLVMSLSRENVETKLHTFNTNVNEAMREFADRLKKMNVTMSELQNAASKLLNKDIKNDE